jgi:hypothetical protein
MTHEDVVRAVRRRLKGLNMTPYKLHVRLKGTVSKQSVYNFVKHGEMVRSDTLAAIMSVLGLTITPKESRAWRRERKAAHERTRPTSRRS